MFRWLATLTQQSPPPQQPFFTNDQWGVVKVLIFMVAPIITGVLVGVWKIMRGPLEEKDKELQGSIDGLGKRVDGNFASVTKHDTELFELRRRADKVDTEIQYLHKGFSEIRTAVESLKEQSQVHKTEIIDAFQKRTQEVTDAVHKLDREIYAMNRIREREERERERREREE